MDFENEMTLTKQDKITIPFEVHWSLFNSAYYQKTIPLDWIWDSSSTIKFNQACALKLNPSINFLYLCGHLSFHHAGKGLLWKHDLAEIIMQYSGDLNWDKLINYAHMYDLVLPLKINTLSLLETYGPILSPKIISKLEEATPSNAENQYFKRLSSELKTPGRTFIYDFIEIPERRKKFLFVAANIFPSINYMKNRYRIRFPIFLPFFYIYRWYLGLISLIRKTNND